ncbi:MAG: hemolysin III family protein [Rhodospirillales bacterium]|nr:hemolysin III family protein [Rhodospirillales bacterium]
MRSRREHLVDIAIQAGGLAGSLVGNGFLIKAAWLSGRNSVALAVSVYAASLSAMFLCSLFNAIASRPSAKRWWRRLDHAAIYLLIVGTYTPFCLLAIEDARGIGLLATLWLVAVIGVVAKLVFAESLHSLRIGTYLAMGWSILITADAVVARLPPLALGLLAAGGVLYTLGVPVHCSNRLSYRHAIWHGAVLLASACHFGAVALVISEFG